MREEVLSTKQRLLQAARFELAEHGWEGTSSESIRRRAHPDPTKSISNGSSRHFFPGGKAEICAIIYAELHDAIWAGVLASFAKPPPLNPGRIVQKAVQILFEALTSDKTQTRMYFQLDSALRQIVVSKPVNLKGDAARYVVAKWVAEANAKSGIDLPPEVCWGLMFGPVLDVARNWAIGELPELQPAIMRRVAQAASGCLLGESGKRTTQKNEALPHVGTQQPLL